METAHEILGVARGATEKEITAAYRRLAMLHHPDRGGDAGEFQKIQTAYETAKALVGVCPTCNGEGMVSKAVELPARKRRAFLDGFSVRVKCPSCQKSTSG